MVEAEVLVKINPLQNLKEDKKLKKSRPKLARRSLIMAALSAKIPNAQHHLEFCVNLPLQLEGVKTEKQNSKLLTNF